MTKYRIIKVTSGNYIHFEIEKKFLWMYITQTDLDMDLQGFGAYRPLTFRSKEEAQEYINRLNTKRETI